jgi:hypothetical protein
MWGALSDERTGLPFTIAAGPRQRSHSWVQVPRDSWPYFTVSDSRLPQPGGPGSRNYIPQEQVGPVTPPDNLGADPTENTVSIVIEQYFDCCLHIRYRGNVFTQPLPSNGRLLIHLYHSNGWLILFSCRLAIMQFPYFPSFIYAWPAGLTCTTNKQTNKQTDQPTKKQIDQPTNKLTNKQLTNKTNWLADRPTD